MKRSVSLIVFCAICDSLMPCTVHCLEKNDSSIYENIESSVSSTFMRYLRLPTALQGTLFWKKMIFHELFQVGACPNLKDSLLFDRISILMYKARIIRYLQQLSSICDSFMPCTDTFFRKKDDFS